jgi:transposase
VNSKPVFLKHRAQSEPEAEHVVIRDGAGFHQKSGTRALPDRIHLIRLPVYSPEFNPIEKLWDVLKDGLCNRLFHSMEELWQALCHEWNRFTSRCGFTNLVRVPCLLPQTFPPVSKY